MKETGGGKKLGRGNQESRRGGEKWGRREETRKSK